MQLSIIVPAHNEEDVIERNLRSIYTSSLANSIDFEVIIVDDGSTDGTLKQAEKMKRYLFNLGWGNMKILVFDKGHGVSWARNRGAECAEGKYLFFLDADDYLRKDTLLGIRRWMKKYPIIRAIALLRKPIYPKDWHRIFFGNFIWCYKGREIKKQDTIQVIASEKQMQRLNCPYVFKKDFFFEIGMWKEGFYWGEDKDMLRRLFKMQEAIIFLKETYYYWDVGKDFSDFKKRAKYQAKEFKHKGDPSEGIVQLIAGALVLYFYPLAVLGVFLRTEDLLVSVTEPFFFFLRRALPLYYYWRGG